MAISSSNCPFNQQAINNNSLDPQPGNKPHIYLAIMTSFDLWLLALMRLVHQSTIWCTWW